MNGFPKVCTSFERGKIRQPWISTRSRYESQKRKSVGSTKLRLRFKLLTSYFGEPPLRSGWFIPEAHCLLISPRTQPLRFHSSAHNEACLHATSSPLRTSRSHFRQRVAHVESIFANCQTNFRGKMCVLKDPEATFSYKMCGVFYKIFKKLRQISWHVFTAI